MSRTLPELVDQMCHTFASRPAVVGEERVVTYGSLQRQVAGLAADLARRGIRPGDRVGLLLRNSPEFVVAYLASVAAGAIVVPLNDHYRQTELLRLVDECGIKILMTTESFAPLCEALAPHTRTRFELVLAETWGDLERETEWVRPALDPRAPVMYQYSSGSTGQMKRIARSHDKLLFELDSLIETIGFNSEDRFLGAAPFSHVNGLMRSMLLGLRVGAALYPVPQFDRWQVADLIQRERLTVFIGVPFMFITLAQTNFPRALEWSALRSCISASAPLPSRFNREFHSRFGLYIRQLYGTTETGTISVNLSPDIEETLESVGRPIAGVRWAIMDEAGHPLPAGQVGEVAVASPAAITGYDGLGEVNRQTFRDGHFFTGDLGRLDGDGRLYLQGRIKFLINKAGFKIDPREVEVLLENHPSVEEAAVVGVPTKYGDEKVKAVIVLRAKCTEAELTGYLRNKIADFKIPSVIQFRDTLPKSPTGKIRRGLLVS